MIKKHKKVNENEVKVTRKRIKIIKIFKRRIKK